VAPCDQKSLGLAAPLPSPCLPAGDTQPLFRGVLACRWPLPESALVMRPCAAAVAAPCRGALIMTSPSGLPPGPPQLVMCACCLAALLLLRAHRIQMIMPTTNNANSPPAPARYNHVGM
jgi:hypothetical protein